MITSCRIYILSILATDTTPERKVSTAFHSKKRSRTAFSLEQIKALEFEFERSKYLSVSKRMCLASRLDLTETQVRESIWCMCTFAAPCVHVYVCVFVLCFTLLVFASCEWVNGEERYSLRCFSFFLFLSLAVFFTAIPIVLSDWDACRTLYSLLVDDVLAIISSLMPASSRKRKKRKRKEKKEVNG